MSIHERYIKRCITLGLNGLGTTRPNPMVGAVIVHENNIIGEGYTSPYGGPHAEVNAINSVTEKSKLKESTLYVTLEPCSHHGKTPPCSDFIIKHQIPKVVIGCVDPNPEVSGKGLKKLTEAGCQVVTGILEGECREHHKRFLTFQEKKRPYIILKWAETEDGFIAPEQKDINRPIWITNAHSQQLVHQWRSEEQAILVGTETVIQDNPRLDVRHWNGLNPTRIVLDLKNRLDESYSVFDNIAETIRLTVNNINSGEPLASEICNFLYRSNINSIIVEGGQRTLQTFINEGLWDEARIFVGNKKFERGVSAPKIEGRIIDEQNISGDQSKILIND